MGKKRNITKIGVIGCGNVALARHLPALKGVPDAEIIALCDSDSERLARAVELFSIRMRYTDFRALLEDPAIEAVGILVPTPYHFEVASAALKAGKHVFLEKPATLTLPEVDKLIQLASATTKKVMVGFNMRWHRLLLRARRIVQEGTLGEIEFISTQFTNGVRFHSNVPEWNRKRKKGGGVLAENAVHVFDMLYFLFQTEIEEVFATSHSGDWDDETAVLTARMANGTMISAGFSECTAAEKEMVVFGRDACLRVSFQLFDGIELLPASGYRGDARMRVRKVVQTLKEIPHAVHSLFQGSDYALTFRAEWHHFLDAVINDKQPECSLLDGRRALKISMASMDSARKGCPVKIGELGPIQSK